MGIERRLYTKAKTTILNANDVHIVNLTTWRGMFQISVVCVNAFLGPPDGVGFLKASEQMCSGRRHMTVDGMGSIRWHSIVLDGTTYDLLNYN